MNYQARKPMPADDVLVSRRDICDIFGCKYMTAYFWEKQGRIPPGTRYGRRPFWRFGDVRRALENAA